MTAEFGFKSGDTIIYKSRKNGGKYIGVFTRAWFDGQGRCVARIVSESNYEREIANPFIEDVELLTPERYLLWKLENN